MRTLPQLNTLAEALSAAAPDPEHHALRRVLERLLPGCEVLTDTYEDTTGTRSVGLHHRDGRPLGRSRQEWTADHLDEADGDLFGAALRMRADGLLVIEEEVIEWFVRIPGSSQTDVLQVVVLELRPFVAAEAAGWACDAPLESKDDLAFFDSDVNPTRSFEPPRYQLVRMDVVEDLLRHDPDAARFARDWMASSAGKGHRLCDHWAFDACLSGTWGAGSIIPRPLTWPLDAAGERKSLSGDWPNEAAMMGDLALFDQACGYPTSWYFHAVYGNCASSDTINRVARAVGRGPFVVCRPISTRSCSTKRGRFMRHDLDKPGRDRHRLALAAAAPGVNAREGVVWVPAVLLRTSAFVPRVKGLDKSPDFRRLYELPFFSAAEVRGGELGSLHRSVLYGLFHCRRRPKQTGSPDRMEMQTTWRDLLQGLGRVPHGNLIITYMRVLIELLNIEFRAFSGSWEEYRAFRAAGGGDLSAPLVETIDWSGSGFDDEVTVTFGPLIAEAFEKGRLAQLDMRVYNHLTSHLARALWPMITSNDRFFFLHEKTIAHVAGFDMKDAGSWRQWQKFRDQAERAFAQIEAAGGIVRTSTREEGCHGRRRLRQYTFYRPGKRF